MLVVEFVVLVTPNVGHAINRLPSVFSRVGCTWSSGFIHRRFSRSRSMDLLS